MSHVVVVGTESALGRDIAAHYAEQGHAVVPVALNESSAPDGIAASLGKAPIDLLIFADDFAPLAKPAESVTREDLRPGLMRLAFLPFRLAALLKPRLAQAGGKIVLLSRQSARMSSKDAAGHYLERPFRAAAHQLWRSLAAEWPQEGIGCVLIAADRLEPADLPALVARAPNGMLVDAGGRELGW